MIEPANWPEPKSACRPTLVPMKLMSAAEFGSTAAPEMSLFHRLSAGNGRKPPRLPPCPGCITLHARGGGGGGGGLPPPDEVTCRVSELDALPPGSGFTTVTANMPAEAAVPVAWSCVADT